MTINQAIKAYEKINPFLGKVLRQIAKPVPRKYFQSVSTFCENENLDNIIWNAQEFMTSECDAELSFDKEEDCFKAQEFLNRLKRCDFHN